MQLKITTVSTNATTFQSKSYRRSIKINRTSDVRTFPEQINIQTFPRGNFSKTNNLKTSNYIASGQQYHFTILKNHSTSRTSSPILNQRQTSY